MSILYILLALFGLGILVFIHELGHYFVAKWCKMRVEVFSIGFGRPLIKWQRGEVTWQIGWLPFGGYVKIMGMEFTKKNKHEYVDPYAIEGGFFSKPPVRRLAVAIAGPLANFILAFLIFTAIWAFGGREKTFSEFTQIVGWVDPHSELYAKGLRPGDMIQSYDHKKYTSSKDLLYAALFSGKSVQLQGEHINWWKGEKKPFTYSISPYPASRGMDGMMTTGIESNARYLIYDQKNSDDQSPNSIRKGDRLVWADGELLFSMEQLSNLINRNYALLTVERGKKQFITRQPRVKPTDLLLAPHIKGEIEDWHYATNIRKTFSQLFVLPYVVSDEGYIDAPLSFIDEESKKNAFPVYASEKEMPLQPGDRIVAVDGVPFTHLQDLLIILQEHKVHIIVEEKQPIVTDVSWENEDVDFEKGFNLRAIEQVAAMIGTGKKAKEVEGVRLLEPILPRAMMDFPMNEEKREWLQQQVEARKEQINKMKDKSKREQVLRAFEREQQKVLLGLPLQDRLVKYNPNPIALFGSIFVETARTLKALLSGNLHPKWLSGPVGIVQVMHHGWQIGAKEALFWVAAISVNLGFLNLLPIPVLDGGYICLALWEMLTKKRVHPKTMERLIIPFVILLIGLLLFLTFQDVSRLF